MINGRKITLCMPCKNEADHIADVLQTVPKQVDEIIVVNNKSGDALADVLSEVGDKRIVLLNEDRADEAGVGYGYAYITGLKEASGDIIVCADADGSYPLEDIPTIVTSFVDSDVDMLLCQRTAPTMSWFARLGGWALSRRIKSLLGIKLRDPLSGMWVISQNAKNALKLKEGGWNFSLEIKLRALTNPKLRVKTHDIAQNTRLGHSKQQYLRTGMKHMQYVPTFSTTKRWRLERIVLGLVICFGILFVALVPPGHNGDEENHFLRVWQLATATPTSGPNSSGAELPVALGELFEKSQTPYRNLTTLKFDGEKYQALREIHADHTNTRFYEFPNTIVYSPVAYIPMYPAVWLGKAFDWPIITTLYAARILGLVMAAILLAVSVAIAVRGKWIFAVAALLPMTVTQAAGVNADGMAIAVSFLFVAYALRLAFLGKAPTAKQGSILLIVLSALVLIKTSYMPLLLLLGIVPLLNKATRKKKVLWLGALATSIALCIGLLWAASVKDVSLLYSPYTTQEDRLPELLAQPLHAITILYNTLFTTSPAYDMNQIHSGFWGTFGWSNIQLPFIFILLSICSVFLAALYVPKEEKKHRLTKNARLILGGVYIIAVCAVTLSLYIIISAPNSNVVELLQGRYFIPLLPVGLLALHGLFRIENTKKVRTVLLALCIIVLIGAVMAVYRRFYDTGYL